MGGKGSQVPLQVLPLEASVSISSTVKTFEMLPFEANIRPIWCSFTRPSPKCFQTLKQIFPPGGRNAFSNLVPSGARSYRKDLARKLQ
jgi:hypothetical protein